MKFKEFLDYFIQLILLISALVAVFAFQVLILYLLKFSGWFWLLVIPCVGFGFHIQYYIMNELKYLFK